MALVGSISGSNGVTAVTSSFIPSSNTFNLGTPGNKWNNIYANYVTASISSSDGTNPFVKAGSNITVNYNSLGQWEITGTAAPAASVDLIFNGISTSTAYSTSSISIGFNGAANSKGSDVFFAVSGSSPSQNTALFSGPVVTSGSVSVKDNGVTVAQITGPGAISGSALQTVGNLNVQGTSDLIGNVTVTGDVAVNGADLTSTATTFNLLDTGVTTKLNIGGAAATVNLGSKDGIVVIPGDLFVSGSTVTVDVSNITIEDPLIGLGFVTGTVSSTAGDRGFIGGGGGTPGENVAFAWSDASKTFVATKTTSNPGATTLAISALQPMRASAFQVSGSTAQVSGDGSSIIVSGSQVELKAGMTGVYFYRDNSTILSIDSGSYGPVGNAVRAVTIGNNLLLGAPLGRDVYVSGSNAVYLDAGGLGTIFRKHASEFASIEQVNTGEAALTAKTGVTTGYLFNTQATTVNIGGAATTVAIGAASGLTSVKNNFAVTGSSYIGTDTSDVLQVFALVTGSLLPYGDTVTDLGSATNRWANIYTGDLHLRNERGDYTLIEEEDFLSIRFNKTGKRYKFVLEPVPELDEK